MNPHEEDAAKASGTTEIVVNAPADPGPFLIDTPEYSDRDREMFVLGFEYAESRRHLVDLASMRIHNLGMTVHLANAPRIVEVAKSLRINVKIKTLSEDGWCAISAVRSKS